MAEKQVDTSLTNSKFGGWGWSMIIYTFLLYFFWAGVGTDGLNLYPDAFAGVHGWNANALLAYATPANIIGVIGGLFFGRFCMRFNARKTSSLCLIVTGVVYAVFGLAPSPLMYAVILAVVIFFATGFGLIVSSTLMSNWFPRKKGIALGWATIGAPACTAFFVQILAILLHVSGLQWAFAIIGIVIAVLGIVSIWWVKDYPEMVGATPDNLPVQEGHADRVDALESYKSPFTIGKLLKDKDMWLIALGFGFLWMVTIGVVSQFVPRMISVGYTQQAALNLLTVAAIIAFFGSYFWGWLDQKVGTKKATLVYSGSYILALILLIINIEGPVTWLAAVFVGLGIGGLLNLMPSLVISVYGRFDFMAANSLVAPIASIIRVFAFVIMAASLAASGGSYTVPYIIFIVLDIIGAVLILAVTDKCKGKMD